MRGHAKASSAGSNPEPGHGPSRSRFFLVLCLAIALATALTASPALAVDTHLYTGPSFGPDGTEGTSFVGIAGVAVDPATNNVYVYDGEAEKIYKFDAGGNPVDFSALGTNAIEGVPGIPFGLSQIAVAPPGSPGGTAGDIYAANSSVVMVFAPNGEKIGELTPPGEPCGVTTDPSGNVFVGFYPSKVREYTPSSNPVTNADESGASVAELPEICNVAADGLGNVYAANFYSFVGVAKLEGLEASSATTVDPSGGTLAVDPSNDDLYVLSAIDSKVAQYDSDGALISAFGAERLFESNGIAVNATSGDVYAANTKGGTQRVDVFGPLVKVPTVNAEEASAVAPTKATLNGTVNPAGLAVTNCEFEYATEAKFESSGEYDQSAPCVGAIPADSSDHPVTAALTGLKAETAYRFRLSATNANGTNQSEAETFTTASLAITAAATEVLGTKATLNGIVSPAGEALEACFFEYGLTESFGKTAPCEEAVPADEAEHPVSAALSGLVPNGISYAYRLVIERAGETIEGDNRFFKTTDTVITGNASAASALTATVQGTINPEGTPLTECKFEYGPTTSYGSSVPCTESPASIGEGTNAVSVHANLSSLTEPTYHYRLVATNALGTLKGNDRFFGVPLIESQHSTEVTDIEAQLVVRISPQGLPTTYHLEFGTDTSYGESTAESAVIDGEALTTPLADLDPDTTYHWRAVATNVHGTTNGVDRTFTTHETFVPETNCSNQAFRNGASAALPDCRAYEMVSPSVKVGQVFPPEPTRLWTGSCGECLPGVNGQKAPMQTTADGETVVYQGQPFSGGLASGPNEYLANRSAGGWETRGLSAPQFSSSEGQAYKAFAEDLTRGVLYQIEPALSPDAPTSEGKSFANLYLWEGEEPLVPLVTEEPPQRVPGSRDTVNRFRIGYAAANAGTATTLPFSHVAFEANDALTPAVPGIAPAAPGIAAGEKCLAGENCNLYEWADGELRLVNVLPGNASAVSGAVIGSGHGLVGGFGGEGADFDGAVSADGSRIFWSEEASGQVYVRVDGEETVEIDDPGTPGGFLLASADGSKVLLGDGCLYDVEAEACDDLTAGAGGFEGILGAAADLSRVYFVDTAVLTGGEENENGDQAEGGKPNLYLWSEGTTSFIGTLLEKDGSINGVEPLVGDWKPSSGSRTAQVSPDGEYLAFMSRAPLTGYDNNRGDGKNCFPAPGASSACYEIFAYEAASGSLSCASCNPSGQPPIGGSNLSLIQRGPSTKSGLPQPGNLTPDGRVFFESQDDLVPRDLNGNIQDVYQWKPEGVGGCVRPNGCVALISSGQSANDSMFVDSTPSGSDAFFITREKLLLRDKDDQLDLYDARISGGFSEVTTPPCLGEACRGPASSPPAQQGPGSSTFAGPGNEKPKKQKKKKKKRRKHKRAAKHNRGGQK